MSTMLRKVVDKADAMDTALKWSLLDRVNDCVKELQLKCTSERSNALNNDEATNSFLWVLEGIFIHGLTNSFLKSTTPFSSFMSSSLFSTSRNRLGQSETTSSPPVPNPSFWEFVLVFLHRDIIDQINSLHLIHTDVGRCRAWLRIALNDGLLLSFLENMTLKSNRRCLKAFYRSSAFLRDVEKCDILKNYLMGIELLDFRLVINNSFLNHWNSGPLSLVGLWIDENESIQQGIDVAENLESKEFQAIPKLHQQNATPPKFYSELDSMLRLPVQPPLLSEEDALRLILSSSPRTSTQPPSPQPSSSSSSVTKHESSSKRGSSPSSPSKSKPNKIMQTSKPTLMPVVDDKLEEARKSPSHEVDVSGGTSTISSASSPKQPAVIVQTSTPIAMTDFPRPNAEDSPTTEQLAGAGVQDASVPVENGQDERRDQSTPLDNEVQHGLMTQSTVSLELESPVVERSYTDMLLKYQQRNQQQQQENINTETESDSNCSNLSKLEESHYSTGSSTTTTPASGSVGTGSSRSKSRSRRRRTQSLTKLNNVIDGLELIKSPCQEKEQVMELLPRISKYTRILPSETGLDTQNYACKMCGTSIGMIYGPARLCNFTGFSYCTTCHISQERVIPSRILLNWDFGLYPVCKQANDFLEELKDQAIFDVQEINSSLYAEIDECVQVKELRTRLFYIGMYLKTCKNTKALEEMRKEAHSKEHLLDSIHMYSITDLLGIPNRSLVALLTKLVATGSGHILSCTICREKGFICEICKKPQVIFPFELEKIFKCGTCGAVYHNTCMEVGTSCPRCERWKKNDCILEDENMDDEESGVI